MIQQNSLAIIPHIRIIGGMGARKLIGSSGTASGTASGPELRIRKEDSPDAAERIIRERNEQLGSHSPTQWGYFCSFCVALHEKKAIKDVGPHGIAFLLCIAYEQSSRNELAVSLKNHEILNLLNMNSAPSMISNRANCVAHGWLLYENKGSRQAGSYRVVIPKKDTP